MQQKTPWRVAVPRSAMYLVVCIRERDMHVGFVFSWKRSKGSLFAL